MKYLENKIEYYEREIKRNSIVMKGLKLEMDKDELKEEIAGFLQENLGVRTSI